MRPAYVTRDVVPVLPSGAPRINVVVLVEVTVDPNGELEDERITMSSNDVRIDEAALRAARQARYAPMIVNCVPTTGSVVFRAEFRTWTTPSPAASP